MHHIDLNSDMGESFGDFKVGNDEAMLQYVSSANIACGWHAGDPMIMDKAVHMAKERGVAVGAHPGCPDLMGFGRRYMDLSPLEVKNYVKYQIGALKAFTDSYRVRLGHISPHGCWGGLSNKDRAFCEAFCQAVLDVDPTIIVVNIAGNLLGKVAQEMGLKTAAEIFADRAYMEDGTLVPRSLEGAVITNRNVAVSRCVRMIKESKVTAITGKDIEIHGDVLCVHGDGASALDFVKQITETFASEGITVKRLYD